MNILHKAFVSASVASCLFSLSAHAQTSTYAGNGGADFGGPIGDGMLTLTNNGTTLMGSVAVGGNGTAYDELVIYISTGGGGANSTTNFMDDGGGANDDILREAVSGYDQTSTGGSEQSIVNFAPGFTADYAIALSPNGANYSGVYALPGVGGGTNTAFGYLGTANLSPESTGNGTVPGPYTFSISLASLGSPTSFEFSTTYLDTHAGNTVDRSNEGFNTVTDQTNPANTTGDFAQDTVLVGENLYTVPEPGTWALVCAGGVLLVGSQKRRARA